MKQTMDSGKHIPQLSKCKGDLRGNKALKPPVPATQPLTLVKHAKNAWGLSADQGSSRGPVPSNREGGAEGVVIPLCYQSTRHVHVHLHEIRADI